MPFSFRKSLNLGPVRINASKRGLGASVGIPGLFRVTKPAGRRKSYKTVTIPGTGIRWRS